MYVRDTYIYIHMYVRVNIHIYISIHIYIHIYINTHKQVKKKFGSKWYSGTVTGYRKKTSLFHIEYDDSDEEVYFW